MQRLIVSLAASVCLVALVGATAPAHAAFVTFVSEAGDDGNDCTSIATPCRQIGGAGGALSKTDSGGVVHVAPGEYGAFEVFISVDIIVDGGQASVVNSSATAANAGITGDAGIVIAIGAGDVVRVRGFILNADHGIAIGNAGGIVHLEDNTFIGVADRYGVIYQPSGASELHIKDSTVARENGATGGGGILIKPVGAGSAKVVLDNVTIQDNNVGVLVNGGTTTGAISMSIRDSVISGSTAQGLSVFEAPTGGSSAVVLERTTISGNGTQGIFASRALASVRVRQSVISGNAVGVGTANGGQIISHGDNVLAGNTTNGAFTSTVAPQ